MKENIIRENIKLEVTPRVVIYPKGGNSSGEFCIFEGMVREIDENNKPIPGITGYSTTLRGTVPEIISGQRYIVVADQIEDPKYGKQFAVRRMNTIMDWENPLKVKRFLSKILASSYVDALYEKFENPIEYIENGDVEALCSVKGIGETVAQRIIQRYLDCQDNAKAYSELGKYGFTETFINKLVTTYKSVDVACEKVSCSPYSLINEVRGVGWNKADAIAMKVGIARTSPERVKAYILYYLQYISENMGATYVPYNTLVKAVKELDEELEDELVVSCILGCVNDKSVVYDVVGQRIGLATAYETELNIAKELARLIKADIPTIQSFESTLKRCEAHVGYEYSEEQQDAMRTILHNGASVLTAKAGCVDCDTEFFNGTKWKKISEYVEGEKVLQYNEDGTAQLVLPQRYIKEPCESMWHIQTKYGIDICATDDHRMYYRKFSNFHWTTIEEIRKIQKENPKGFMGSFPTTFKYGGSGLELSDIEIKIMLAVICDGSLYGKDDHLCRFHIKKDRKKEKLREIFKEANIEWRETRSATEGYTDFYITPPIRSKIFGPEWYNCSHEQLQIICDNILFWDGSIDNIGRRSFSTTIKQNADFVQFAFEACGLRAGIYINDRRGKSKITNQKSYERKSVEYDLCITDRNFVRMGGNHPENAAHKAQFTEYKTLDGFKYCFTVPSSLWIMRRNNRIMITGNCGKSASMFPIVSAMLDNGYTVGQCCLSGRAALNLTEYTGLQGMTIHRMLGWKPGQGFTYNDKNQLPYDMIILDEVSMVGGEIFLSLLKAIKTGARLVMVGDFGQLEPIGIGNVGHDIVKSGVIPHAHLTKIFRQAQASGIITESSRVYEGESIVSYSFLGSQIRGKLQDFKLMSCRSTDECFTAVLSEYKRLHCELGISTDNITVCGAKRALGPLCTRILNDEIQKLVKADEMNSITIKYKDGEAEYFQRFRVGDRVSVVENSYQTKNVEEEPCPIFNGNVGTVTFIDKDGKYIHVKFAHDTIVIPRSLFVNMRLGYAITTHRAQGIGVPYVIAVVDPSARTLLSKELVYTQITRAKKFCTLVGTPEAINFATSTTRVQHKPTWLAELIQSQIN